MENIKENVLLDELAGRFEYEFGDSCEGASYAISWRS